MLRASWFHAGSAYGPLDVNALQRGDIERSEDATGVPRAEAGRLTFSLRSRRWLGSSIEDGATLGILAGRAGGFAQARPGSYRFGCAFAPRAKKAAA